MFTGPPENVRDHIMAASRALAQGDWSRSYGYIKALNAWNLLPKKEQVRGRDAGVSTPTWGSAYA